MSSSSCWSALGFCGGRVLRGAMSTVSLLLRTDVPAYRSSVLPAKRDPLVSPRVQAAVLLPRGLNGQPSMEGLFSLGAADLVSTNMWFSL